MLPPAATCSHASQRRWHRDPAGPLHYTQITRWPLAKLQERKELLRVPSLHDLPQPNSTVEAEKGRGGQSAFLATSSGGETEGPLPLFEKGGPGPDHGSDTSGRCKWQGRDAIQCYDCRGYQLHSKIQRPGGRVYPRCSTQLPEAALPEDVQRILWSERRGERNPASLTFPTAEEGRQGSGPPEPRASNLGSAGSVAKHTGISGSEAEGARHDNNSAVLGEGVTDARRRTTEFSASYSEDERCTDRPGLRAQLQKGAIVQAFRELQAGIRDGDNECRLADSLRDEYHSAKANWHILHDKVAERRQRLREVAKPLLPDSGERPQVDSNGLTPSQTEFLEGLFWEHTSSDDINVLNLLRSELHDANLAEPPSEGPGRALKRKSKEDEDGNWSTDADDEGEPTSSRPMEAPGSGGSWSTNKRKVWFADEEGASPAACPTEGLNPR